MNKKIHILIIIIFVIISTSILYLIFKNKNTNQANLQETNQIEKQTEVSKEDSNSVQKKAVEGTNSKNNIPVVSKTTPVVDNNLNVSGISLLEVSKHNNKNDCWMQIDNGVYNVTSYVGSHPAGRVILDGCGKDATAIFNDVRNHGKSSVDNLLKGLFIGNIQ